MRHLVTAPTELSAPFWKATAEHRLIAPRCNRTGRFFFPPQSSVPGSDHTDWNYAESSGLGALYSYSVVYRPVTPDFDAPYVLAVVDLLEGWTMLTNLIDCEPAKVYVGMPVQVDFLDVEGGSLPVFRPGKEADTA